MKIGIIGAGQLGRMLALAGYPLGLRFVFVDSHADAPGGQVGQIITGGFGDAEALAELAEAVDVITFDVENVPVDAVRAIAERKPFLPPVEALAAAQDRLEEKRLFSSLGIPTAQFVPVQSLAELEAGVDSVGLPAMLKTRRLGYDGRGQVLLRHPEDAEPAWKTLGEKPMILEGYVAFEREVSIIGVRRASGETRFYPLSENVHDHGILSHSRAPVINDGLQELAQRHLLRLMDHLDYCGVLTIEFFVADGRLLANEMAPRVHNSGHWTIEGAVTSQFENHIRAILDLPLGDTAHTGHSGMVNLIGELPPLARVLGIQGTHYHAYGKSARPRRKLGHCTVVARDAGARDGALMRLLELARPRGSVAGDAGSAAAE